MTPTNGTEIFDPSVFNNGACEYKVEMVMVCRRFSKGTEHLTHIRKFMRSFSKRFIANTFAFVSIT